MEMLWEDVFNDMRRMKEETDRNMQGLGLKD